MQPSRILKTKKRLSRDDWWLAQLTIVAALLATLFFYALRVVSFPYRYGSVYASLPVLWEPSLRDEAEGPDYSGSSEITKQTITLLMTTRQMIVGTTDDFSQQFYDPEQKISVDHLDGAPRLDKLQEALSQLGYLKKIRDLDHSVIIFAPDPLVPMSIVIQCIHYLRSQAGFESVVLATGFV